MTAHQSESLTCIVCRKPLASGEEYLVRVRAGRRTTVHRHLCFPPAAGPQQTSPQPNRNAA
jgi:hypothetical protein